MLFSKSYTVIKDKFIVGEYPASKNEEECFTKLNSLIAQEIEVVINLMEPKEKNNDGELFFDYTRYLKQHGIETYQFPIVDLSIPSKEDMKQILNKVDSCIKQNKKVYLHCWGGIGRTGTVVGCYLLKHKIATKEIVFNKIEELKMYSGLAHRASPEMEEQYQFILDWD